MRFGTWQKKKSLKNRLREYRKGGLATAQTVKTV